MNFEQINAFHLKDINNNLHPSVFFRHEDYDLFILRIPKIIDGKLIPVSKAFVITDNSYYYYDKDKSEFIDLIDAKGFYKYLNQEIDSIMQMVNDYLTETEDIEDSFYEGKVIKNFNKQWTIYKNELIKINRILSKAIEVFSILIYNYKNEDDYLERNFEDMHEHLSRAHRSCGMMLEKLDALHNSYIIENNEQMNRTVYILTLLSGIFLPLNLIVGFFGMNTTSLPFTQGNDGTFSVINILIFSALISTILVLFIKKRG